MYECVVGARNIDYQLLECYSMNLCLKCVCWYEIAKKITSLAPTDKGKSPYTSCL